MVDVDKLATLAQSITGKNPKEILSWAFEYFMGEVVFASSLGLEDQVLTEMISEVTPQMQIITLDTGRLFPETYDLLAKTEDYYKVKFKIYNPDFQEVEIMVQAHGINLFYQNVENRKLCCSLRKVKPLRRALFGKRAWITGLRQEQALTRDSVKAIEWDSANEIFKLNPLWNWSEQQVWEYIRLHTVPYNPLHDQGFPSIGCACCTRAIKAGEDIRAGRWWWENNSKKECGLHNDR